MYILDTSVFYKTSIDETREKFKNKATNCKTSITSILEILSGIDKSKPGLFSQRKAALNSLLEICGRNGVFTESTDNIIDLAFGKPAFNRIDIDRIWKGVELVSQATDISQLDQQWADWNSSEFVHLDVDYLRQWDEETQSYHKSETDKEFANPDPEMVKILMDRYGIVDKKAKRLTKSVLSEYCLTENYRRRVIISLAMRAKVIDFAQYVALASEEKNEIECDIISRYNGTLDFFIKIYQQYQSQGWAGREQVGTNDGLDLDPLIYLKETDSDQYVTGEKLWVEIINKVKSKKALFVHEVIDL